MDECFLASGLSDRSYIAGCTTRDAFHVQRECGFWAGVAQLAER